MQRSPAGRNRARRGAVTLQTVAEKAGVSTATVSRFLNDAHLVSQEVRGRVEAAIRDLGYIPHHAARTLASNRSRTIGAIVPTLDNAIFSSHITSFQKHITKAGYTLLLATFEYDLEVEFKQAQTLLERGVDALSLVGERRSDAFYALLERADVPFVNTWVWRADSRYPCCGFDHEAALKRVVDHLVELGHRTFAVVTGFADRNDRVAARLAGTRQALAAHGITLDERLLLSVEYSYASGREALRRLRALDVTPAPTAIIAGNDVIAAGILFEAKAQGIDVPGTVSVVGFGDYDISKELDPPLTTVRSPKTEIGERAAEYLLSRLAGRETPERVELEARFCPRGSTAPPPAPAPAPAKPASPPPSGARKAAPKRRPAKSRSRSAD
ncbi:LacI family DNA-binding transcriptional regulator [Acuticoccus sp. M5D2P5]|uniref:LacI family DNA-binding transcriptional regulator n=1 Tax=Acuticoccus kalidii TaxID=2910977 RepID=UPI001F3EB974|nr:LacI family DNA-binding transcriptional regulator [Acuticoccus kalidii]MCF3935334.1 LacI family DNA-binding transcriptional regulator [Acuticoccus kalidii]